MTSHFDTSANSGASPPQWTTRVDSKDDGNDDDEGDDGSGIRIAADYDDNYDNDDGEQYQARRRQKQRTRGRGKLKPYDENYGNYNNGYATNNDKRVDNDD